MTLGQAATLWTIRASLTCAWLAAAWLIARPPSPRRDGVVRGLWTAACALYLAHMTAAFGAHHGWSHAAAYAHVLSETRRLVGLNWGGGLYINYLFSAAWIVDCFYLWLGPGSKSRAVRCARLAWLAFFLFIVVNATIVFHGGALRWVAVVAFVMLAALWLAFRGPSVHPPVADSNHASNMDHART